MRKIIYSIASIVAFVGIIAYVFWDRTWILGVFVIAPILTCFLVFSETADELERSKEMNRNVKNGKVILDEAAVKKCIAAAYQCHPNDVSFDGFGPTVVDGDNCPTIQCIIDSTLTKWIVQEVESGNLRVVEGPKWLKPGGHLYTTPEMIIVSEVKED